MTDTSFPPLRDLSPGRHEALKRHLLNEVAVEPEHRRLSVRPLRPRSVVPAAAAICAAAAGAVVFFGALGGSATHRPIKSVWGNYNGQLPTLAHPLWPRAKRVTLAEAAALLGVPVVLPNTTLLGPADVGTVWEAGKGPPSPTIVAVTFPSQGVIVGYTRPAPSDGSAAHFQAMAQSMPSPDGTSEGQVIDLASRVPALAVRENSDDTGANFGSVIFNLGGSEVTVMGHDDQATLTDLALSILRRSGDPR